MTVQHDPNNHKVGRAIKYHMSFALSTPVFYSSQQTCHANDTQSTTFAASELDYANLLAAQCR